jgi:hypothetical protein
VSTLQLLRLADSGTIISRRAEHGVIVLGGPAEADETDGGGGGRRPFAI